MVAILSSNLFVHAFQRALEHDETKIPAFLAKLISMLALLRRSNGDVFSCLSAEYTDFVSFLDYCRRTHEFLLTLDLVSMFPSLGSRFYENSKLYSKIDEFFDKIYSCSDPSEVIRLFMLQFNWISRANDRNIVSVQASSLFKWVISSIQDSRNYGFRFYRSTDDNILIFKSDIDFNKIYAFISIMFIDKVYVSINNDLVLVPEGGMFEDVIDFDTTSVSTFYNYLFCISNFFNSIGSSESKEFSPSKIVNNKKNVKVQKSKFNNVSLDKGEFPSGSRGFSSNSRNLNYNNSIFSVIIPVKNRKSVEIKFSTLSDLNDFMNNLRI